MNDKFKMILMSGIIGALSIVLLISFIVRKSSPSIVPRVVIIQDKPQEWADALKLGLYDGLREQGFTDGKDVIVIHRSAAGDPQGLTSLAEAVSRQNPAVIYTLGTQASQAVFRTHRSIPMVFGAVTDPVEAGFYEKNLDTPKGNVTGTQDLWPYPAQFDLINTLIPNTKKVGIIYNSSEVNSQVSVKHIKEECEKRNLELLEKAVTEESQVLAAVGGLLNSGIHIFFIPADNTAQTSAKIIISACNKRSPKVPVFTGIPGIVQNGALGTVGTNYYELGKVNAWQIAHILKGQSASEIPVRIADKGDLYLNLLAASELGISVPEDLKKKAVKVYE